LRSVSRKSAERSMTLVPLASSAAAVLAAVPCGRHKKTTSESFAT